jgi:N-methylhydantoinase A
LRTTAFGELGRADTERVADAAGPDFEHEIREVVFGGERHRAPLVRRDALAKGHTFDGPAIVVEGTATTVVPPGYAVSVDAIGSLVVRDKAASDEPTSGKGVQR